MSSAEINQNIQIALRFLEKSETISDSFKTCPVYKKIARFSLRSFFYHFGVTTTPLFKLIQTEEERDIPDIVVITCSNSMDGEDEPPIMLNDDIYMTATFFREWISALDAEGFEKPVLDLVLSNVQTTSRMS